MSPKKPVKRKHPWRKCPLGKHWRRETIVRQHKRNGKIVKRHIRKGTCAENFSRKDQIYTEELVLIARRFSDLKGPPSSDDLGYKYGNNYDELIRGWTKFWNETLRPSVPLDPNLVKALIATESSFYANAKTKVKRREKVAHGLMQVTGETLKYLADEKGELRDHLVNLTKKDLYIPTTNIAAGIRWLFHKKDLMERNGKKVTWDTAVAKYKSYPASSPKLKKFHEFYNQLSKYKPS